jgi:serine acetyltransferase
VARTLAIVQRLRRLQGFRAPLAKIHPLEPERDGVQRPLFAQLREEWEHYERDWSRPGFRAMVSYRFGYWRRGLPSPWRQLLFLPARILQRYVRNHYGIELPPTAKIGRRLSIPHQHGIVIHHFARIGDDCWIHQGVTLGAYSMSRLHESPTLGDRVRVASNAVVIGGITVGEGATIGPNTVVTMDVPAGSTVFAPPPRIIPASSGE